MSFTLPRSIGSSLTRSTWIHARLLNHQIITRSHTTTSRHYKAAKTSKRLPTHLHDFDDDYSRSVISYNLSEELMIDKAQKLVETFKGYEINHDLPDDLTDEAVMISSKLETTNDTPVPNRDNPLHDILLFREGAIVFWGVPHDQQRKILNALSPLKRSPYSNEIIQNEREHLNFSVHESIEKSKLDRDIIQISLNQDVRLMRLDQFTVSHAIALSVKLGVWEVILENYIESIGRITGAIKRGERVNMSRRQVLMKTGEIYQLKHQINLGSDLLDLPDVYWDRYDQEVLFLSLASFFNMRKRISVINEKLCNCCELMNLLSDDLNNKHHIRLEWMIIILIMVEVSFEILRFLRENK